MNTSEHLLSHTLALTWDKWKNSRFSAELRTQQGLFLVRFASIKAAIKNDCGSSHIHLRNNCATWLCLYI